jgi:hypothetical protein
MGIRRYFFPTTIWSVCVSSADASLVVANEAKTNTAKTQRDIDERTSGNMEEFRWAKGPRFKFKNARRLRRRGCDHYRERCDDWKRPSAKTGSPAWKSPRKGQHFAAQSPTIDVLAAVGEDIGEANETNEEVDIANATLTDADRKIIVDKNGVITIPATACSKPTSSTGKIIFMESVLGGTQLHYSRTGDPEEFEYTFDAPAAGKYSLSARVVTPSWKQHLLVAANGAKEPVDIALPHTVGMWDKTQPVEVNLARGRNVLRFSRNEPVKGLTIKDFTLTPVK